MIVKLINLGHNNINKTITCNDVGDVYRQIGELISYNDLDLVPSETTHVYIVCAGIRPVGRVEFLDYSPIPIV